MKKYIAVTALSLSIALLAACAGIIPQSDRTVSETSETGSEYSDNMPNEIYSLSTF